MKFAHGAALVAASLVTLAGCAGIQRQQAADAEQLLHAAGFEQQAANTPAREASLRNLKPRQLFARADGSGRTRYVFADPYNCQCLYVGGQSEYARLQQLRKASVEDHNRLAAQAADDRYVSEDVWGPWEPAGLVAK
jgi:hypothetical protein